MTEGLEVVTRVLNVSILYIHILNLKKKIKLSKVGTHQTPNFLLYYESLKFDS
jgi:hypothetical protein